MQSTEGGTVVDICGETHTMADHQLSSRPDKFYALPADRGQPWAQAFGKVEHLGILGHQGILPSPVTQAISGPV